MGFADLAPEVSDLVEIGMEVQMRALFFFFFIQRLFDRRKERKKESLKKEEEGRKQQHKKEIVQVGVEPTTSASPRYKDSY